MVTAFAMQQPEPFDAVRTAGAVRWAASAFRFEAGARALVVVHCLDAPPVPLPEHSKLKACHLMRRWGLCAALTCRTPPSPAGDDGNLSATCRAQRTHPCGARPKNSPLPSVCRSCIA